MRRFPTILILAALALSLGLPPLAAAQDNDIGKVNGSVQVAAGQQAVHIGEGASVHEASTVNGKVELGDKAQATELGTVNGAISLGGASRVSGKVNAVNGSIQLARGAEIGGRLENVNGAIVLDGAHVAGGIGTVGGDITVGADSRVEGGILVDKPNNGWFHWGSDRKPVIVIGPHAVVQGTLEFRREVVLKVSDSAQIGSVKGATVEKFSGAMP
jgi:predicted acyltransferase (DUF342 family)